MRRLFPLVAAVILVDTMFYAAITPLLPGYAERARAVEDGRGGPERLLRRRDPDRGACHRGSSRPGSAFARRCWSGSSCSAPRASSSPSPRRSSCSTSLASPRASAGPAPGPAGSPGCWPRRRWRRRGEMIGAALAAAIFGILLGPVIGGIATVTGPEVVFCAVAVIAAVLAAWVLATPAISAERGAERAPRSRGDHGRAGAVRVLARRPAVGPLGRLRRADPAADGRPRRLRDRGRRRLLHRGGDRGVHGAGDRPRLGSPRADGPDPGRPGRGADRGADPAAAGVDRPPRGRPGGGRARDEPDLDPGNGAALGQRGGGRASTSRSPAPSSASPGPADR